MFVHVEDDLAEEGPSVRVMVSPSIDQVGAGVVDGLDAPDPDGQNASNPGVSGGGAWLADGSGRYSGLARATRRPQRLDCTARRPHRRPRRSSPQRAHLLETSRGKRIVRALLVALSIVGASGSGAAFAQSDSAAALVTPLVDAGHLAGAAMTPSIDRDRDSGTAPLQQGASRR